MIDPVTAIAGASAAFNAIKKGIQVGRDLEGMGKDLSRWGKAMADFDFAAKQIEKPPWYKAMGGGVEAQAMELFVQRRQLQAQREELRKWISAGLGPSAWQELLKIEAEVRKAQREHEYRRIEIRQKIIEWSLGIFLFVLCMGGLFVFVWLMRNASG
tara:strand:- start:6010 stop:6480 length:471 start_codon:yes stop_codon:yes gene_type:complete